MIGLGGTNLMGIGLAVVLQDSFTKPAAAINQSMLKLSGNSQKVANSNSAIASSMAGATVAAGAAALYGLYKATDAYSKYDYALQKVHIIAGLTTKQLDELDNKSKSMATTYGLSVDQIMQSNVDLAKAGVSGGAIQNMTKAIATLSVSADEPASELGDKLINMMTQFGIASKNTQRFADQLTQAANKSTINVKDMFNAVSYVGATAHNLNIPFEQVATQIALIGNAGIRGSRGGTQLANMYRYLAQAVSQFPVKRQQQALAAMHISPKSLMDMHGNLKSVGDIIDMFQKQTQGMSSTKVQNLTNAIFGPRGSRAFIALLSQGRNAYDQMYNDITTKSQGISEAMALKLADTPEKRRQRLAEQWHQFVISIGKAITPLITAVLPAITGILAVMTQIAGTPVGHVIIGIAAAFIAVRTATAAVRMVQLGYNQVVNRGGSANTKMAEIQSIATGKMKINLMELIGLQKEYNASAGSPSMAATGGKMRYPSGSKNQFGENIGGRFMSSEAAEVEQAYTGAYAAEASSVAGMATAAEGATMGLGSIIEFATGPWGLVIAAGIALAPALDNFGILGRVVHGVIEYFETLISSGLDFNKAYNAADKIIENRNADGTPDNRFRVRNWDRDRNSDNLINLLNKQGHTTNINLTIDGKKTTQKYMTNYDNNQINSLINL